MRRKTVTVGLTVWWIFIFGLTSIPGESLPSTSMIGIDKVVHLVMYGVLSFWLSHFLLYRKFHGMKLFFSVFSIGIAYSFLDEWHQPFVGRAFSLYDVAANCIGVTFVALPISIYYRTKEVVENAD